MSIQRLWQDLVVNILKWPWMSVTLKQWFALLNLIIFLQQYILQLTAPLYEKLGFIADNDDEHVTAYHRNIILDLNCRHGNEACTSTAQTLLENFKDNPGKSMNLIILVAPFQGWIKFFFGLWKAKILTCIYLFCHIVAHNLNPDIQNLVYCAGLRGGSVDNFNFLWERYLNSQDHSEQSILLNALGCTSNAERREL